MDWLCCAGQQIPKRSHNATDLGRHGFQTLYSLPIREFTHILKNWWALSGIRLAHEWRTRNDMVFENSRPPDNEIMQDDIITCAPFVGQTEPAQGPLFLEYCWLLGWGNVQSLNAMPSQVRCIAQKIQSSRPQDNRTTCCTFWLFIYQ